jgi:2-iminobutanoate/2-iminopropanoate deaminase
VRAISTSLSNDNVAIGTGGNSVTTGQGVTMASLEHHSFSNTTVPPAYGAFSHAVTAEDFVFVAGQIARHPTGDFAGGDIASQTRRCIEIVADILGRLDLTLHDVVRCTVYLSDIADFAAMNAVYAEAFGPKFPARSTPQVQMPFGAKVGLEVTAYRGSRRRRPSSKRTKR